jgi:hypothetical protein
LIIIIGIISLKDFTFKENELIEREKLSFYIKDKRKSLGLDTNSFNKHFKELPFERKNYKERLFSFYLEEKIKKELKNKSEGINLKIVTATFNVAQNLTDISQNAYLKIDKVDADIYIIGLQGRNII